MDFADVKAVMSNSGTAMLGVGTSTGKNRAEEAAQQATSAPLIERSIERATGIVYNITGGKDLTLQEVNRVSQVTLCMPACICLGIKPERNQWRRRILACSHTHVLTPSALHCCCPPVMRIVLSHLGWVARL